MSFDWGSRPTDYGRGGDIDMDLVYNDPRFATAVSDAIKQSPTMRSAFPHSSIDPRAVYPVQRVTTLPNARERYEGLEVEYYPSGLGESPVWRCVWRASLNGGSGAWSVVGGAPMIAVQSAAAQQTTASVSTYADLTNGPTIATTVGGVWDVVAMGDIYNSTGAARQARTRISDGTNTSQLSIFVSPTDETVTSSGSAVPHRFTTTGGVTFHIEISTDNQAIDFGVGGVVWRLSVMPLELRP